MVKSLSVAPLDASAFAPFGEVIATDYAGHHFAINGGNTERYHDLARLEPGREGKLIVSIFRAQPRALPFTLSMLERHPLGSQAFMPLGSRRYLVVVALPGDTPDPDALRAFVASSSQGVNYAPGVWHHPLLALDAVSEFLVIDRSGPGHNCDEFKLAEPLLLALG